MMSLQTQPNPRSSQCQIGIVDRPIAPAQVGRIRFQGSFWKARFQDAEWLQVAQAGDAVAVVGRQGITLLVVPL